MSTCKYELFIRANTGQEITEAVAELLEAIGGGQPAEEEPSAAQSTGRKKAAPKKKAPAASKKKAEPAPEPAEDDDGEGPSLDDVTSAASDLVNVLNGDMKRAQELVHSEFKVRRISELTPDQYKPFIGWAQQQVELIKDLNELDDDMPPEAPAGQDEDED